MLVKCLKRLTGSTAIHANPPQSYGTSSATWDYRDHLPANMGECAPPQLPPGQPALNVRTLQGRKGELTWVAAYILRQFTRPQPVTHTSSYRA